MYVEFEYGGNCPQGGWNDLVGSFDTLEEAKNDAINNSHRCVDRYHVVDIELGKKVLEDKIQYKS